MSRPLPASRSSSKGFDLLAWNVGQLHQQRHTFSGAAPRRGAVPARHLGLLVRVVDVPSVLGRLGAMRELPRAFAPNDVLDGRHRLGLALRPRLTR